MIPAFLGRWAVGILIVLAVLGGTYALGHRHGTQRNEGRWQVAMAAEQTRQAAARAKALDQAVARELTRAAENEALEKQVTSYEEALARRPVAGCVLSPADIGELRQLQGGSPR